MPRVQDTAEVRAVLREWAEDDRDQPRAERAHEAYLSTQMDASGFSVLVDDEMLKELRRRVRVQQL